MTPFPWHVIDSGERFQDLVGCLLLQEVSKHVNVFVKAGRDYCIDASYEGSYEGISGSWKFQCKHYSDLDDLKADLRGNKGKDGKITKEGEIHRILNHLDAVTGSVANRLWSGTTQYRLITSLKLLPQQRLDILDILQPPLQARGITVDVWDGAKVELLCSARPFVTAQIFGDDPPLFLPLSEFRRQQLRRPFGDFYSALKYVARDHLTEQFTSFLLSTNSVFLIIGTGGIGKTRSILELAALYDDDPRFQIRAIQTETENFSQHLNEISDETQHLLVIDEIDRYNDLSQILLLATKHRRYSGRVRILAACRGAVSSPIISSLEHAFGANKVVIASLPRIEAASLYITKQLGHEGPEADSLIRMAEGVPLWLVLASEAIKHGVRIEHLTKERVIRSHINHYLKEVAPQEKELHQNLLDVLALIEPVNIRDPASRDLLATLVRAETPRMMRAVQDLLHSGFAEQRGRFLCIYPDLVADFLLMRSLFTEDSLPTDRHRQLLDGKVPDMRRLIAKLARAEFISGEPLLDEVIATVKSEIGHYQTVRKMNLLIHFAPLAYVRPEEFSILVEQVMSTLDMEADLQSPAGREITTVLDLIPSMLEPVLRKGELRGRALELLAQIAERQHYEDRAGTGAMRIFSDSMQYPVNGDLHVLWSSLEVLRAWWLSHGPQRLELLVVGIDRLLSMEVRSVEFRGLTAVFGRGRVPLTEGLQNLRAEALKLLELLLIHSSMQVRVRAADVLRSAASELGRSAAGVKRLSVAPASSDPSVATAIPVIALTDQTAPTAVATAQVEPLPAAPATASSGSVPATAQTAITASSPVALPQTTPLAQLAASEPLTTAPVATMELTPKTPPALPTSAPPISTPVATVELDPPIPAYPSPTTPPTAAEPPRAAMATVEPVQASPANAPESETEGSDDDPPTTDVPKSTTLAYLDGELDRIFAIVERFASTEREPHVLDRLISAVRWYAKYAPGTPFCVRARKIIDTITKRPEYRLYGVVAAERDDSFDDDQVNALMSQIVGENRAEAFVQELKTVVRDAGDRALAGGAHLLLRMGVKFPDFSKQLLPFIDEEFPRHLPGNLVAGIRVSGDEKIISVLASGSLKQQRIAAIACTRIRPSWHQGFQLTNTDFSVMRALLAIPDRAIRHDLLLFLPAIVSEFPEAGLDLVEAYVSTAPEDFIEQIAHACLDAFKASSDGKANSDGLRTRVRAIFEQLIPTPHISGYYANRLLADLARADLKWFFGFLAKRVECAAGAGIPAYRFEAVPKDFAQAFIRDTTSEATLESALTEAMGWLDRSARFVAELPRLIHGLTGELVSPLLAKTIRTVLANNPSAHVLERLSAILHEFRDDRAKFSVLGECLAAAPDLSPIEEQRLMAFFATSIGRGVMSWTPGETPPALLKRLELLNTLKSEKSDNPLVVKFANVQISAVNQEIAKLREQDEEFLVEY